MELWDQLNLNEMNMQKARKIFEEKNLQSYHFEEFERIARLLNCPVQHVVNWHRWWMEEKNKK